MSNGKHKAPKPPATGDALIRRLASVAERAGWKLTHTAISAEGQVIVHADRVKEDARTV